MFTNPAATFHGVASTQKECLGVGAHTCILMKWSVLAHSLSITPIKCKHWTSVLAQLDAWKVGYN